MAFSQGFEQDQPQGQLQVIRHSARINPKTGLPYTKEETIAEEGIGQPINTTQPVPGPEGVPQPKDSGLEPTLVNNQVNAPASTSAPAAQAYAPIQGFDTGKLNNTAYSSGKYTPAVRAFSAGLGSGVNVARNDLGGMVDYAKKNGFANAQAVGDDKIDFGDGNGPIDVIQSNGSIWFQNGQDRFGGSDPGQGAGSAIGGLVGGGKPPISLSPRVGYGPSKYTPNSFWEAASPEMFGRAGQQVPDNPLGQQNSDLLQQLLSRIQLSNKGIGFKG